MRQPKIEFRDPAELTVHPVAKKLPSWSKSDERFFSLVEDVRDRGIDQPLKIDAEGRILDGRECWRAAKQLQLAEVPVVVVPAEQCLAVILHSLVNRKHYTKGALAYVAYPLLSPVLEESRKRQVSNLKSGKTPENSRESIQSTLGRTVEEFASALGFGRDLFFQARNLHTLFDSSDVALAGWEAEHPHGGEGKPTDLRAEFEPRLLSGEIGLGAAIAGIAGQSSTKGRGRPESEQLLLFEDAWDKLQVRACRDWDSFDQGTKRQLAEKIKSTVLNLPEEIVETVAKAIRERSKERGPKS